MKTSINIIILFLIFISIQLIAQEHDYSKEPGYINFGDLASLEDGEEVTEILIEEKLLKLVSKFTNDDEDLSKLIGGLKLIKVNTFEVTPGNAQELLKRANALDKELLNKKWDRIVKTKSKGEISNVYLKTGNNDEFVGLTVVSVDSGGEAAFVNIVGKIDLETIGKLGDKFDIPAIDNINKK